MGFLRFLILVALKFFTSIFYRTEVKMVGNQTLSKDWNEIRLILVLNHTSLFEFLYSAFIPAKFFWRFAFHGGFPVADSTLEKPLFGTLLRAFAPKVIPLTRKRDSSWEFFLDALDPRSVIIFFPEGRMKRLDGLDKFGQKMSVKSGVVDLLDLFSTGKMLVAYAGGLHHIAEPGRFFPRLFKSMEMTLEAVDIEEYLAGFSSLDVSERRLRICRDLDQRRDQF